MSPIMTRKVTIGVYKHVCQKGEDGDHFRPGPKSDEQPRLSFIAWTALHILVDRITLNKRPRWLFIGFWARPILVSILPFLAYRCVHFRGLLGMQPMTWKLAMANHSNHDDRGGWG